MTDWNKEASLLTEYIGYRVEWYARYLTYDFNPPTMYRMFTKTGVLYSVSNVKYSDCLTFEEWREGKTQKPISLTLTPQL